MDTFNLATWTIGNVSVPHNASGAPNQVGCSFTLEFGLPRGVATGSALPNFQSDRPRVEHRVHDDDGAGSGMEPIGQFNSEGAYVQVLVDANARATKRFREPDADLLELSEALAAVPSPGEPPKHLPTYGETYGNFIGKCTAEHCVVDDNAGIDLVPSLNGSKPLIGTYWGTAPARAMMVLTPARTAMEERVFRAFKHASDLPGEVSNDPTTAIYERGFVFKGYNDVANNGTVLETTMEAARNSTRKNATNAFGEWIKNPEEVLVVDMGDEMLLPFPGTDVCLAYRNCTTAAVTDALFVAWAKRHGLGFADIGCSS